MRLNSRQRAVANGIEFHGGLKSHGNLVLGHFWSLPSAASRHANTAASNYAPRPTLEFSHFRADLLVVPLLAYTQSEYAPRLAEP